MSWCLKTLVKLQWSLQLVLFLLQLKTNVTDTDRAATVDRLLATLLTFDQFVSFLKEKQVHIF